MRSVPGPARFSMSSRVPTASMRPSAIESASALGSAGSCVRRIPLIMMVWPKFVQADSGFRDRLAGLFHELHLRRDGTLQHVETLFVERILGVERRHQPDAVAVESGADEHQPFGGRSPDGGEGLLRRRLFRLPVA